MWKVGKEREPTVVCSLVKSPVIYLEPIAKAEITLLMEEYRSQEWLAYLKGRVSEETTNIFIEELSVPPHKEASGASAEAEPFHIPDDCVGIIHSHHTMGAFHSGVDQDYVDKNFPSIREQLPHKNLPYSGYTDYVIDENGKVLGKDEIEHIRHLL